MGVVALYGDNMKVILTGLMSLYCLPQYAATFNKFSVIYMLRTHQDIKNIFVTFLEVIYYIVAVYVCFNTFVCL